MSGLEVTMMKRIGELKAEIEALQAEVVRLKIYDVEHWQDQWLLVVEDNNKLRAEVERLRASSFVTAVPSEHYERVIKAGDAMASALILFEMKSEEERQDRIKAWSAAKEGRPNE